MLRCACCSPPPNWIFFFSLLYSCLIGFLFFWAGPGVSVLFWLPVQRQMPLPAQGGKGTNVGSALVGPFPLFFKPNLYFLLYFLLSDRDPPSAPLALCPCSGPAWCSDIRKRMESRGHRFRTATHARARACVYVCVCVGMCVCLSVMFTPVACGLRRARCRGSCGSR